MPIQYYPEGGVPNGHERANAPGSLYPYVAPTALDAQVTSLLEQQIYNTIFGTTPDPYFTSLQVLMFDTAPKFFGSDEASWFEMPDQRMALTVDDGASPAGTEIAAETVNIAGGIVTVNMPVTQASYDAAGINKRVHFAGGWAVIVEKIPAGVGPVTPPTLVLRSLAGLNIPAIVQGAIVPMGAEIRADSERRIVNHMRAREIKRTNFITTIMNSREYGRKEWLKWKNSGTTNKLDMEKDVIIYNTKVDAVVELWNGNKNAQQNDNGSYAKGTDGIKTQMLNGGVVPVNTSLTNFIAAHEALSFATNYKGSGVTYNIATEELLHAVGKEYKEAKIRYTPDSRIADLGLDAIKVGSRTHVLVPSDIFGDLNYFPGWEGHYFMIDKKSVEMAGMTGMPFLDVNGMLQKRLGNFEDGYNRDDLNTWPVEMTFAPMLINPLSSGLLIVN